MTPRLREQILSEWRGYSTPKPQPDRCVQISNALGPLMKKLGLGERLQESDIQKTWTTLVGEFLAAHSVPDRLREGVLWVRVIQPTLLYELDRVWKPEILRKLKAKYGAKKIRDIRFRAG